MSNEETKNTSDIVTEQESAPQPSAPQRITAAELAATGALDGLLEQIDAGNVQLSGDGGLIPELIKGVLERGLQAEMTAHPGVRERRYGREALPKRP